MKLGILTLEGVQQENMLFISFVLRETLLFRISFHFLHLPF